MASTPCMYRSQKRQRQQAVATIRSYVQSDATKQTTDDDSDQSYSNKAQAQIESKTMAEKRGDLHPARTPSPPGF